MTADGYATRFCGVLELPVASFRYHHSPPVVLEHSNHLTHLHGATISEEKNQTLHELFLRYLYRVYSVLALERNAAEPLLAKQMHITIIAYRLQGWG